jgi:hypothetical protein
MVPEFHLTEGTFAEFYQALLPDFILALVFFTALSYAMLARRFEQHHRAAIAVSVTLGIALAVGLVWWEQSHGYTIRNLGPFAIALALISLAAVIFQAIKLVGGTVAGIAIAIGAVILTSWLFQVEWPVAEQILHTITGAAIIIGLIALLAHHRPTPSGHVQARHPRPPKVDVGNLYDEKYVSEKLRRGFRDVRRRSGSLAERPREAGNIMLQLRRMLPAEGKLTERVAELRAKAFRARNGHVARIESIRHAFSRMNTAERKQASEQLAASYHSMKLDDRLQRLDHAVAATEARIRDLTTQAQRQLTQNDHRGLTDTLKQAEKLQTHNSKLLRLIRHTEEKLNALAKQATTSGGERGGE